VAGLPELIVRRNVTHLQCTPSVLRMLLADPDGRRALARLELVLVGGEALPGGLARDLRGVTEARIRNMYGPTETTVWSTTAPVSGDEEGIVPIGRPVANTRIYVLDARGEPLPEGAPGELWIGGAGVARGYHDRSALTAERFVDDPFAAPGARMYRTGDRARWRPDGTLEFLGRIDQQVKLRGHRIELGEVEAALRLNPGVEAAAVVVRGEGAGARLTAYTVGPASTDALRTWLAERLPDAMVPDDWSVLDALPLTPNGKVDRRRLPDPRRGATAAAAPSGTSDTLAGIWARVLGLDEVGPDEDFFELGGNSLSTIQVAFEIREAFGIELPLRAFFRAPTVRALAHLVEEELVSRAAGEDLDSLIDELSALSDEEARRLVERE
jgi:acyl-coenzyme A synthetase/AMP-(fatty) acid ligase/acyl carrier protein